MCREVEKLLREERNEARMEAKIATVRAVTENLSVSMEKAMEILNIPDADKETIQKSINRHFGN